MTGRDGWLCWLLQQRPSRIPWCRLDSLLPTLRVHQPRKSDRIEHAQTTVSSSTKGSSSGRLHKLASSVAKCGLSITPMQGSAIECAPSSLAASRLDVPCGNPLPSRLVHVNDNQARPVHTRFAIRICRAAKSILRHRYSQPCVAPPAPISCSANDQRRKLLSLPAAYDRRHG